MSGSMVQEGEDPDADFFKNQKVYSKTQGRTKDRSWAGYQKLLNYDKTKQDYGMEAKTRLWLNYGGKTLL